MCPIDCEIQTSPHHSRVQPATAASPRHDHTATMCNVLSVRYTCGHSSTHRISQCRATRTTPRLGRAFCRSAAMVERQQNSDCGPCQFRNFKADIEERIKRARAAVSDAKERASELSEGVDISWGDDTSYLPEERRLEILKLKSQLKNLEDEAEQMLWALRAKIPPHPREQYPPPTPHPEKIGGSRLREEVKPEDDEELVLPTSSEANVDEMFPPIFEPAFLTSFEDTYGSDPASEADEEEE
ncbi:hypothetical protein K402DRAFT_454280 [Aulographum hederae CBS 113979]|uniref:Uncharacterized protein n=1 Tax=Aulographum hederae CBS 113979 TaxID=1176131 RepID=A0A6G1H0R8_9PEZI|nr:hypothetical protein K402DRAFT_454280 [Aulographum hederae CBS 113979]